VAGRRTDPGRGRGNRRRRCDVGRELASGGRGCGRAGLPPAGSSPSSP
jgi:hypothetical protein